MAAVWQAFLRIFRRYAVNAFLDVYDLCLATVGNSRDQSRGCVSRQLTLLRQQFFGFCLGVGKRFVEVLVESHRPSFAADDSGFEALIAGELHDLGATVMILAWNLGTAAIIAGFAGIFGRLGFAWVAARVFPSVPSSLMQ